MLDLYNFDEDIMCEVLSHLDAKDLAAICLANRTLYSAAIPLLVQSLTYKSAKLASNSIALFSRIPYPSSSINTTSLASRVRKVSLSLTSKSVSSTTFDTFVLTRSGLATGRAWQEDGIVWKHVLSFIASTFTSLRTLVIEYCPLGVDPLMYVRDMPSLARIEFRSCILGWIASPQMPAWLSEKRRKIRALVLDGNCTPDDMFSFAFLHASNSNLDGVNLSPALYHHPLSIIQFLPDLEELSLTWDSRATQTFAPLTQNPDDTERRQTQFPLEQLNSLTLRILDKTPQSVVSISHLFSLCTSLSSLSVFGDSLPLLLPVSSSSSMLSPSLHIPTLQTFTSSLPLALPFLTANPHVQKINVESDKLEDNAEALDSLIDWMAGPGKHGLKEWQIKVPRWSFRFPEYIRSLGRLYIDPTSADGEERTRWAVEMGYCDELSAAQMYVFVCGRAIQADNTKRLPQSANVAQKPEWVDAIPDYLFADSASRDILSVLSIWNTAKLFPTYVKAGLVGGAGIICAGAS